MGRRIVERRLRQISTRLRAMRDEVEVIDEQLAHLVDEADDMSIRALVAETPGAGVDYRQARAHADAMASHREHVLAGIAELEARQDQLLDELAADR